MDQEVRRLSTTLYHNKKRLKRPNYLRKADSIVEKAQTPPSRNKHDFFSLSPYYWPDPNNPKGPYILKDGQTNPESTAIPDKQKVSDVTYRIKILSSAYHFANDNKFASKAIEIMQIWFLESGTYMNPNLQYRHSVVSNTPEPRICSNRFFSSIGLLA